MLILRMSLGLIPLWWCKCYLKTGKMDGSMLFLYLLFSSICFRFFVFKTIKTQTFNLWFQFFFIQRLALCNPYCAFLLKISLINNLWRPMFQNYFVPWVVCLSLFFQFYFLFGQGFSFLWYSILAFITHVKNPPNHHLGKLVCFLLLGLSIKEENTQTRCADTFIHFYSYPFWVDLLYIFGISRFLV